jgi:predicted  nucleic acid-binding Zn-ribbon protein
MKCTCFSYPCWCATKPTLQETVRDQRAQIERQAHQIERQAQVALKLMKMVVAKDMNGALRTVEHIIADRNELDQACHEWLKSYQDQARELSDTRAQIERQARQIEDLEDTLRNSLRDAREALNVAQQQDKRLRELHTNQRETIKVHQAAHQTIRDTLERLS